MHFVECLFLYIGGLFHISNQTRLLTSGSSLKVGPVGGAVVTTFLKKSYFGTKKCINCLPKTLVVCSNVVLVSFCLFSLGRHCEGVSSTS